MSILILSLRVFGRCTAYFASLGVLPFLLVVDLRETKALAILFQFLTFLRCASAYFPWATCLLFVAYLPISCRLLAYYLPLACLFLKLNIRKMIILTHPTEASANVGKGNVPNFWGPARSTAPAVGCYIMLLSNCRKRVVARRDGSLRATTIGSRRTSWGEEESALD